MIHFCITPRSLNRRLGFIAMLAVLLLSHNLAWAKFRSNSDREIVKDVLKIFKSECTIRASVDNDIIRRMEIELAEARRVHIESVLKCFEVSFSQLSGIGALYQKICNDVSANPEKISNNLMARQFLDISKYQGGIRSYHSTLNECLLNIPDRKGRPYIIPLAGSELDVTELSRQLEEIRVKDPFPATGEPYR
jgi:hypothetical protein